MAQCISNTQLAKKSCLVWFWFHGETLHEKCKFRTKYGKIVTMIEMQPKSRDKWALAGKKISLTEKARRREVMKRKRQGD